MLGTAVNAAAIVAGGLVGLLIKGRLKENLRATIMQGIALAVALIGFSGAADTLINGGASTLVFIMSLAVGGLAGAALDIDHKFTVFAAFIERKISRGKEGLSKGFVTGSILYCVGTMAVVGSIESGVLAKHDILFAKSALDGISAIVLGAALGPGIILSAASVFLYQGAITLAAGLVSPYITQDMLAQISVTGGVLVLAIGLNLLNVTKIKLANFLPAIFVPVVYYAIYGLFVV
ncbi:MAG: DUF554 domain-containing protein [Defluviitaleaceae bacterium]|nr:DUF554 domain-containing protein [Defluviitaleaceae bacterium]MCL2835485.1 DUF554 domain-containing protein [Defluviitaleaceae bacterium]